ncbi:response regulator [Qipengyuania zhejiangensis]|uniref:response regulator n=1 Tax=Qipengyuania zhejiangensis TaxID=3077782 RepID=UPI002D76BC89|nr:response regulator [Qipengyuania sp. Z2]
MLERNHANWAAAAKPADHSDVAAAARLRVLLAEDTPISAEVMLAMARHLSIDMDHAANGIEAIDMVHEAAADGRPYSLLLLDAMMPILDGVETARRLRAEGLTETDLPIIAVTAATHLDEVRAYRAAGMQAFLEKPVGLEDLRAALNAWGHRTRRRNQRERSAAFEALRNQYELRKITTLDTIRTSLLTQDLGEATVMEVRTLLHQLAGTAGSFGDPELSEIARTQEAALLTAFFAGSDVRPVLEIAISSLETRI